MGRIEEALRRATPEKTQPVGTPAGGGQVFVSAWPVVEASPEIHRRDEPVPVRSARPSASSRQFHGFSQEWLDRLVVSRNSNHTLVEQFRHLAGGLHHAQTNGNLKSLMVTSAVPADGKTFTALNLALTLARSYARRVLLIDADLRRPSIGQICGLDNTNGLSDALRSENEQKLPVYELVEGLTFLPAGRPDPDPVGGLSSSRMKTILQEAAEQFDWIIVDAPPATPLADAGLVGAMVDAVLLVVRAGDTQYRFVEKAIEAIGRDRIFGVVLNGADQVSMDYQGDYGERPAPLQ